MTIFELTRGPDYKTFLHVKEILPVLFGHFDILSSFECIHTNQMDERE